eukprot:1157666-Pelagomonas_calceolata.AAC.4
MHACTRTRSGACGAAAGQGNGRQDDGNRIRGSFSCWPSMVDGHIVSMEQAEQFKPCCLVLKHS